MRGLLTILIGAPLLLAATACDDAGGGDVAGAVSTSEPDTCVGPAAPEAPPARPPGAASFALTDFQPASCGFGDTYGLERFVGKPTLVALLSAS